MKTVKLLWTGGYDSTYRLIQLSFYEVKVQPYYLRSSRLSEELEIKAIWGIRETLLKRKSCKATILEPTLIPITERKKYDDISSAYKTLRNTDFFGSQYVWLAEFARGTPRLELSIHKDDKAVLLINKYGCLKLNNDEIIGDYYTIDKDSSAKEIAILFGDFVFPLIDYTKVDMKSDYIKWGYKDVMEMTWFCQTPTKGKPCGYCNPCIYAVEEGMGERLSKIAKYRYRFRSIFKLNKRIRLFIRSRIKTVLSKFAIHLFAH